MRKSLYLSLFIFRFVVQSNFSHSNKYIFQAQSQLFKNNCFDLIIYSLNKSWVWVLLLDNVVLDINPNKHAAIIKTIIKYI